MIVEETKEVTVKDEEKKFEDEYYDEEDDGVKPEIII